MVVLLLTPAVRWSLTLGGSIVVLDDKISLKLDMYIYTLVFVHYGSLLEDS